MTGAPSVLNVYGEADGDSVLLGRLSYDARRTDAAFEWSEQALELGVEWSPLNLPLSRELWRSSLEERDLLGLPGLIHDALPDGWGLLLMDRAFAQRGFSKVQVTPMLRLAFLADRCWGALRFDPEWGDELQKEQQVELELLAQESRRVQEGDTENVSKALLMAGGSPHGARPKIMVAVDRDARKALIGHGALPDGYRHVLIKFAGENEAPTVPLFEFCYGEAARGLGLATAKASVVETAGRYGLCLDRFDRQNGLRQHVHSLAGMLHVSHRYPTSDWSDVAQVLKTLPGGSDDLHQAFQRAVFNAVFSVRDDHTKNIAFMRRNGRWGLTPAYDLAYAEGAGGYHAMTYAEHTGVNVRLQDLWTLAERFEVDAAQVSPLVEASQEARSAMMAEAKGLGVAKSILKSVGQSFLPIDKSLKPPIPKLQRTPKP